MQTKKTDKSIKQAFTDEQIRAKAHEIWKKRGKQGGTPESDWDKAIEELKAEKSGGYRVRTIASIPFKWAIFTLPTLDWMKLLAVPLALSITGAIISSRIQEEAKQNEALNNYYNQIQSLMFDHKLMVTKPPSETLKIARARTLTNLGALDNKRKIQLLQFLGDSLLIKPGSKPVISLRNADLSNADLRNADLGEINLSKANLSNAKLSFAFLVGIDFREANLSQANLSQSYLVGSDLSMANLKGADLSDAILGKNYIRSDGRRLYRMFTGLSAAKLYRADLRDTNLKKAFLGGANLSGAKLSGMKNFSAQQIKSAKNWGGATYNGKRLDDPEVSKQLGLV